MVPSSAVLISLVLPWQFCYYHNAIAITSGAFRLTLSTHAPSLAVCTILEGRYQV